MLVLSRKLNERICIGGQVVLTVLEVSKGKVRLGFQAPEEVLIFREEVFSGMGSGNPLRNDATEGQQSSTSVKATRSGVKG